MSEKLGWEVYKERERCAFLAEELARRWRYSARTLRERNTARSFWFGSPYVTETAEKNARALEGAAAGLEAVAYCIRRGYDDPKRISDTALLGVDCWKGTHQCACDH